MNRSRSAKLGHIKRRLLADEPLTGETLELALSLVNGSPETAYQSIAEKLKAGAPLNDYECHLMVDVRLLHARLAHSLPLNSSTPEFVQGIDLTKKYKE